VLTNIYKEEISLKRYLIIVLFLCTSTCSCSPVLKLHNKTDATTIAVLKNQEPALTDVEYIDGIYIQRLPSKNIFEILPGHHIVQARSRNWNQVKEGPGHEEQFEEEKPVLVEFNALPRHLYSLYFKAGNFDRAELVDVTDEFMDDLKSKRNVNKWSWGYEYFDKWQLK
jgi:hypothetical protein